MNNMLSETHLIQITVSFSSLAEAEGLVKFLLKQRWVACGQIIKDVQSFYRWQGQLENSEECLLLLKTKATLFDAIEQAIVSQHSYDTPEIIATPLVAVSESYKKWIDEEVI